MKKILSFALVALFSTQIFAQHTPEQREEAHQRRIQKEALMKASDLKLKDADILWFSNLYIEYQKQLRAVLLETMKNMPVSDDKKDAAINNEDEVDIDKKEHKALTDAQAEYLILGGFDRQEKEVEVKREFYKLFREKLTPKQLTIVFMRRPMTKPGNQQARTRRAPGMMPMMPGHPHF